MIGCILSAGAGFAQRTGGVVNVRMALTTDAVHAGTTVRAIAFAQIAPGFHINDHHPTLKYLIPTELRLEPQKALDVERVVYPHGRMERFVFADTGLSVYEGEIQIPVFLKVMAGVQPGEYALSGKLTYQACNNHACLPPASAPLLLKIRVVKSSVQLKPAESDAVATPPSK
ncbi:MAG: protein-disulfide reductase DsbD domain-containing protein [Terriglobia bacterium]